MKPLSSALLLAALASLPLSAAIAQCGFPASGPWVSDYGPAVRMGNLDKVARTFRIINVDLDPGNGHGNFTRAQVIQLKAGGRNKVLSYLNLGSMESDRTYWTHVPAGFMSGRDNKAAHLGLYGGYPSETWMNLGNAEYQHLILDYVAPRLVAQGADGFYLDNLELVEHRLDDKNGPCSPACRQGGLDLVRRLREKYPKLLIVMQNATGDITRLGKTGGVPFPSLLDGIAHEEVWAPRPDRQALAELKQWRALQLRPGGRPFWIGTEDYVGSAVNLVAARAAYAKSRAAGFSPYAADASARQQTVFYWPF
jgi:cysteinyl-tRNA synthetase